MPTKRRYRKKRLRKKKYRIKSLGLIIPDKLRVTLPYSERTNFTGTSFAQQVFRGNSIYDPDATGAGDFPLGYDEWKRFYNTYYVRSCRIVVTILNMSAADNNVTQCTIVPSTSSAGFISVDEASDQRHTVSTYVSPNDGGNSIRKISKTMKTLKFKQQLDSRTEYMSSFATNPIQMWYYILAIGALDGITVLDCIVKTKLYYDCEFSVPIDLARTT